jgi:hypothetical protein
MKYEIPNCQNKECHQFSYGSENNCRATESYNDPKKCKDYEPCPCGCGRKWKRIVKGGEESIKPHAEKFMQDHALQSDGREVS